MTRKPIIVGGGYLGAELAKAVETDLEVTLIEQRDAIVHAPAMIRVFVDPSLLDRALSPYDQLRSPGEILHARVSSVEENGVTLDDGTRVEADFVVIANGSTNGSTNGAPFKPAGNSTDNFRASHLGGTCKAEGSNFSCHCRCRCCWHRIGR